MRKSKVVIFAISLFIVSSCRNDHDPNPVPSWTSELILPTLPDPDVDIYLAGDVWHEDNNVEILYWKNGIPTILGTFNGSGYCGSLDIKDNRIYAAAYVPINPAKYWVDGNSAVLGTTNNGSTSSIYVSGENIYVLGTDDIYHAVYWENGNKKQIDFSTSPSYQNETYSIAAISNDCYISGTLYNAATCWKNGEIVQLENQSPKVSKGRKMTVSDNDIYIAGFEDYRSFADSTFSKAVYWKNGQEILLSGANNSAAEDMYVSGSDVYVCGFKRGQNNLDMSAVYWKNGQMVVLSDYSYASSIKMVNGHLYICGNYKGKGAIWIDGTLFYTFPHESDFVDMKIIKR